MAKISLSLLFCLVLFSACEKFDKSQMSDNCCLPAYLEFGDSLVDTYGQNSTVYYEMIFMPSAITPNGDFINDKFGFFHNYFGNAKYIYKLRILYKNELVFERSGPSINDWWDGKSSDGKIYAGYYLAELTIHRNGLLFKEIQHRFKLISSNSQNRLSRNDTCQTFADEFDSRQGLIYESMEMFE
jgi:hypothetical protein